MLEQFINEIPSDKLTGPFASYTEDTMLHGSENFELYIRGVSVFISGSPAREVSDANFAVRWYQFSGHATSLSLQIDGKLLCSTKDLQKIRGRNVTTVHLEATSGTVRTQCEFKEEFRRKNIFLAKGVGNSAQSRISHDSKQSISDSLYGVGRSVQRKLFGRWTKQKTEEMSATIEE